MERAAPLTDRRGRSGSRQYGSDHSAEEREWMGMNKAGVARDHERRCTLGKYGNGKAGYADGRGASTRTVIRGLHSGSSAVAQETKMRLAALALLLVEPIADESPEQSCGDLLVDDLVPC